MRNTRTVLAIAAAALCSGLFVQTPLLAQADPAGGAPAKPQLPQRGGMRQPQGLDQLKVIVDTRLTLTPEQKTKIDAAIKEAGEAFEKLQVDTRAKIVAVLDEKQQETFKAELTRAAQGGMVGGNLADRMKENLAKLNLTEEQKAKVEKIIADNQVKMQELRKTADPANRGEMFGKMQEIAAGLRKDIEAVLTPEQAAKLKEIMEAAKLKEIMPAGGGFIGRGQGGQGGQGGRGGRGGAGGAAPAGGNGGDGGAAPAGGRGGRGGRGGATPPPPV